jgi:hypothetical protein
MSRVRVLGAYVEIVLATGDLVAADAAAEELRALAAELGTPYLRAQAARARGSVLVAGGNARTRSSSSDARSGTSTSSVLPSTRPRVRLLIADACTALGDADAASDGVERGRSPSLDSLGSPASETHGRRSTASTPQGRTRLPRLGRSLVLLALGKTNQSPSAPELFISEKTVASHVESHLHRSSASRRDPPRPRYAYDHHLVGSSGRLIAGMRGSAARSTRGAR